MRRIAALTAVALLVTAHAQPVLAQRTQSETQRTQPQTQRSQASSDARPAAQPHLITIDFEGGTLADLVDALKAASPQRPVNILYSTEAANIPIPPFEVADAELRSTLQSLAYTSAGSPTTLSAGRTVRWEIAPVGDGVYAVTLDNSPQYISTPRGQMLVGQSDRITAVHSITELTTGGGAMSADAVLSAIQAALSIAGAAEEAEIRYHEETGLVFARVTHDQGGVIEQTLVNLRRSMEARLRGESKSQVENIYQMTGVKNTGELVMRIQEADEMRNRVLELQRTIAELQTHIINLQAELDRRRADERDRGGN
ncbi:hypothetical protein AY599_11480 [Leptolyngbya valderiana BDU 20041]|nr:hypothetical protein AY599_11480 [Leptolyngbya valderiana BDU 20041]